MTATTLPFVTLLESITLSPAEVISMGVVATLVILIVQTHFSPHQRVLRTIPGPLLPRFTSLVQVYIFLQGRTFSHLEALHKRYGTVVRTGPTTLSFNTLSALKAIYHNRAFLKTPDYAGFDVENENIFSTRNPHLNKKLRLAVGPAFSASFLRSVEGIIKQAGMDALTEKYNRLTAEAGGQVVVDLSKDIHYSVSDIIGEMVFGVQFGMVASGKEHEFMQWFDDIQRMLALEGLVPGCRTLRPWISKKGHASFKAAMEFVRHQVDLRREKPSDRQDILGRLMSPRDPDTGELLNPNSVESEAFVFFVAGVDTTSSLLTFSFGEIMRDTRVLGRLKHELWTLFPTTTETITYAQLARERAPYLWAVVQESFRCFPPGGNGFPRWSETDQVIDGLAIPAKTTVMVPLWALHRNETIFGNDVEAFRPERWLPTDEEMATSGLGGCDSLGKTIEAVLGGQSRYAARLQRMEQACAPFSTGVRVCIAKSMALLEVYLTLATLLRRFDVELLHPEQRGKIRQIGFNLTQERSPGAFLTRITRSST